MATFQEFFCNAGGSNLNGGSEGTGTTAIGAAQLTSTGGDWDASTGVFTCADAPTLTAGMVGMYASVYVDGDTVPTANQYTNALITAIDNIAKTITLSTTKRSLLGTGAATSTANDRTIKVGGAWAGPGATVTFPIGFLTAAAKSTGDYIPRCNFNGTFTMGASLSQAQAGPIVFQGYGTSAGDGTRCNFNGNGGSYDFSVGGTSCEYEDIEWRNTGAGAGRGFVNIAGEVTMRRCISRDHQLEAFVGNGNGVVLIECEAYNWNKANTGSRAGFGVSGIAAQLIRCVAHDATGSNTNGFESNTSQCHYIQCRADNCGKAGFEIAVTGYNVSLVNCDAYKNGGAGFSFTAATGNTTLYMENCNAVRNGGAALSFGAATFVGHIVNLGHYGNTSGLGTIPSTIKEIDTVLYDALTDPWNDPETGDFTITNAKARGTGRGSFLETKSGYGGTVCKPDIGAASRGGMAPAVGDVQLAVAYGAAGTEYAGTFAVPTEAQVESGVGFGAGGTEFEGTLVAGGGTFMPRPIQVGL